MSLLGVENLGKAYHAYSSEWHRVTRWFGIPTKPSEEHWVLRHVNFDIHPGEAIGIIGQNGAGKSTLLKIIVGTLQPTEGQVQVNGHIAAILELGMGFNSELTGHQNVFHAAGLMGFSAEKIQQAMPDIEAFAEIGEYFDEPVRTYSSGMQMRVAFAVVTAFRPEIMIIDEALAVGDAAFQRKCFRRFEDFRLKGTSLLLVTHDNETVKRFCERAIWLHNGRIELEGDSKVVCEGYEKHLFGFQSESDPIKPRIQKDNVGSVDKSLDVSGMEVSYGGEEAEIVDFSIQNRLGQVVNVIPAREPFSIRYQVLFHQGCKSVTFGMMIKTVEGVCVFATNTKNEECRTEFGAGEIARVSFDLQNYLAPGTFYINCGANHVTDTERTFLHRRLDVGILRVIAHDQSVNGGIVDLQGRPNISVVAKYVGGA